MIDKLMVLYFSAFDFRRINSKNTPYLYGLTENFPMIKMNTIPDVDMKTTMWSGTYPHEHGMWQVKLKDELSFNTKKIQDYFPDLLTTTFQCIAHRITGKFDLAGVADWRRRQFDIRKAKYLWNGSYKPLEFNGIDSIFNIIGEDNCNFYFVTNFKKMIKSLNSSFINNKKLQIFDAHATDHFTHWNIQDEDKMAAAYKQIDERIEEMHKECQRRGITTMILSDHAQERVKETIDIVGKMKELGIQKNEISYFIEASKARFWFHTDSAREKMLEYLSGNEKGTLLHFEELYKYGIEFDDDRYGEYYFVTNPGVVFYPNDFYHPLANLYLGLTKKQMRARLESPVYRGYHGHLPHNDSEKGFVMLLDENYKANREEIEVIDVTPTVLNLLGYEKPESLKGESAYSI